MEYSKVTYYKILKYKDDEEKVWKTLVSLLINLGLPMVLIVDLIKNQFFVLPIYS